MGVWLVQKNQGSKSLDKTMFCSRDGLNMYRYVIKRQSKYRTTCIYHKCTILSCNHTGYSCTEHLHEQSLVCSCRLPFALSGLPCNHTDVSHISLNSSMNWVTMFFKIIFPCCLVITLITRVPHISMNWVYMLFEITFPVWLVITLITTVPHISMDRVYMSF